VLKKIFLHEVSWGEVGIKENKNSKFSRKFLINKKESNQQTLKEPYKTLIIKKNNLNRIQ